MRRWFLSYHSPGQPLAPRVKDAIERKDTRSHVFFAPEQELEYAGPRLARTIPPGDS